MKRTLSKRRSLRPNSFTLVELLVVMGIIAILASAVTISASAAIKAAKRAKAANMANQLQTAVLGYYTEYSVYPIPTNAAAGDYLLADKAANAADWKDMVTALCGNIDPYTGTTYTASKVGNSRSIAFLSLKKADVDANTAPLNPIPTGTAIYFNLAIDGSYDGILGSATGSVDLPDIANATSTANPAVKGGTSTAGVAVWANCNGSTTSYNPAFWVKTY